MKKLLYLFTSLLVLASCSSDSTHELQEEAALDVTVQESTALRISLNQMKDAVNHTGRSMNDPSELCFQFVYPIVLEYNDGSQVTVADYPQLLEILLAETMDFHITAIGFPFDVIQYSDNSTVTITSESEFQSLIVGCGYDPVTVSQIVAITEDCFTVVYPITVLVDQVPQIFNSQTEAENYFLNNIQTITSLGFQYPFSVVMVETATEVSINNDYELITLVDTTCGIN